MKKTMITTVLLMLMKSALFAGSLSITPLRIDLSAHQKSEMLTVKNTSNNPMLMQLHLVAWNQKDNKNLYTAENRLLAVPSIFTIQPGATQNIRVGMRAIVQHKREQAYRLYIREILPSSKGQTAPIKVRVALRVGIPVFVSPPQKSASVLTWQATCLNKKELVITAKNLGNTHAKVLELAIDDLQNSSSLVSKKFHYILSSKERSWSFVPKECPKLGTKLKLSVLTDTGRLYAKVVEQ